jgi:hypothetical protein
MWRRTERLRASGDKVGGLGGLLGRGKGGEVVERQVATGWGQRLIVWAVHAVLGFVFVFVGAWTTAAAHRWPVWLGPVLLGVLVGAGFLIDQTWLSLHPFYRTRLARRSPSAGPACPTAASAHSPTRSRSRPRSAATGARSTGSRRPSSSPPPPCPGSRGPRPDAGRPRSRCHGTTWAGPTSAGSGPAPWRRPASRPCAGTSPCRPPWPCPGRRSPRPWAAMRPPCSGCWPSPTSGSAPGCPTRGSWPSWAATTPAGGRRACPAPAGSPTSCARSSAPTRPRAGCCCAPTAATGRTWAWSSCCATAAAPWSASTPAATPRRSRPPCPRPSPWPMRSWGCASPSPTRPGWSPAAPTR